MAAKDIKSDIKMLNQRCKMDEGNKMKLPSKEDGVLELASMEERRLALRLDRLNIENKSQLKHLARETREVREMIRKQQVIDRVGISPRGSMDRLNLPPIHGLHVESHFGRRASGTRSNPASPIRQGHVKRIISSSTGSRRPSATNMSPDSHSKISLKDIPVVKPISLVQRTSSGHSLPTIALDSSDSDLSVSGSSTPTINIDVCMEEQTADDNSDQQRVPLTRTNHRTNVSSASMRTRGVDLPPSNFDRAFSATIRHSVSDTNLSLPNQKKEICLDPRFKRLESILIRGKNDTEEDENDENPSEEKGTNETKQGEKTKELSRSTAKSHKPVRLVPIKYDSMAPKDQN